MNRAKLESLRVDALSNLDFQPKNWSDFCFTEYCCQKEDEIDEIQSHLI